MTVRNEGSVSSEKLGSVWTEFTPYWENSRLHNCNDKYVCEYTNATCDYSLAEAIERDRAVLSFQHASFLGSTLIVKKNETTFTIKNNFSKTQLRDFLFTQNPVYVISQINDDVNNDKKLFPKSDLVKLVLDEKDNYYPVVSNLSYNNRKAKHIQSGKEIALINGWEFEREASRRNPLYPHIYSREISKRIHFISIDSEKGHFELFDSKGNHEGAFDFYGVQRETAIKGRVINL